MDSQAIIGILQDRAGASLDLYERRPQEFQLIHPITHEDGDMVDIYLVQSPTDNAKIRICDFGLTLMRLSYTHYETNTDTRKRIFNSILINNGVRDDSGNLYMDSSVEDLYPNVLKFAGCVQKICNMRFWKKEIVRSSFYEDLKTHILQDLARFDPTPDIAPLPDYPPITVDWSLTHNNRKLYLFGVNSNDKAKSAAISLLELQKARMKFISMIVHEDIETLGRKERIYLTRNADKQYPDMSGFMEKAAEDINRIAS